MGLSKVFSINEKQEVPKELNYLVTVSLFLSENIFLVSCKKQMFRNVYVQFSIFQIVIKFLLNKAINISKICW